jgi:hypothetical protein
VETFIVASLLRLRSSDPYRSSPSGFGRLLAAIGVIGLIYMGLQSVGDEQARGFGLSQTAVAAAAVLE